MMKNFFLFFASIEGQGNFGTLLDYGSPNTDLDQSIFDFYKEMGGGLEFFTARGKRKKFKNQFGCDEDQCEQSDACDPNATCQNKCQAGLPENPGFRAGPGPLPNSVIGVRGLGPYKSWSLGNPNFRVIRVTAMKDLIKRGDRVSRCVILGRIG